jgi:prefoldin subunit 5
MEELKKQFEEFERKIKKLCEMLRRLDEQEDTLKTLFKGQS